MKMNPLKIAHMVNKALKNKEEYKRRAEELKKHPLSANSNSAVAIYDVETNRIAKISCEGIDPRVLNDIRKAVNSVFDKSDAIWADIE